MIISDAELDTAWLRKHSTTFMHCLDSLAVRWLAWSPFAFFTDKDGDGMISANDLREVVQSLGEVGVACVV